MPLTKTRRREIVGAAPRISHTAEAWVIVTSSSTPSPAMMIAQVTGLRLGEFIHTFGDAHLYNNHLEQAKLQLTRDPRPLPTMEINPGVTSIFDFCCEDFELVGYDPHPHIKAEVSV